MHGSSFATECNNPPGPEKTCLWSVTIRVLSSPFPFVPLIVPSPYLIFELATHTATASAVQMSIGHGFFVCNKPKSHIVGRLTGLHTLDTLLLCNGILLHLLSVNSVNIVQGSVCTPVSILKWHTLWTSVIQNFTNTSPFLWHVDCRS